MCCIEFDSMVNINAHDKCYVSILITNVFRLALKILVP